MKKAVAELSAALKATTAQKFVYAKQLADDDRAPEIISWALTAVHAQLAAKPQLAPLAAGLLDLHAVLAEPQFNRRLAIERLLFL